MNFETRRKLFHVTFGTAVFALVYFDSFPLIPAAALLLLGPVLSWVALKRGIPVIDTFLDWFERGHHRETFPGRGAIFSLAGMVIVVGLFPKPVALAALIGLVAGDTLSHLVGKGYGTIDNPLNPEKDLEGFLAGFLGTALLSAAFLHPVTAVFAAFAGMVVESLEVKMFSFEIDDNLTVPVTIAVAAYLFSAYALPLL